MAPGVTNVLQQRPWAAAGPWQTVVSFVSASNACSLTIPLTNGLGNTSYRVRTP